MANGEPPDANVMEMLFANSFITPQFLDDEKFSEEFEDFVGSCLKPDPDEVYRVACNTVLAMTMTGSCGLYFSLQRASTQDLLEHEFLADANTDVETMCKELITQYKDWREVQPGICKLSCTF